jgi:tryptophan synthase beta chain
LISSGRAQAISITDAEALDAALFISRTEGIIPALETAHAFAALDEIDIVGKTVVVCLSGRGDKDLGTYMKFI